MKRNFLILFALAAITFAGCNSDKNKNQSSDSLMQDSSVMDTTQMGTNPADSSAMRVDSLNADTSSVTR